MASPSCVISIAPINIPHPGDDCKTFFTFFLDKLNAVCYHSRNYSEGSGPVMEYQTKQIAARLKGARMLNDISAEEMASATDKTLDQYLRLEEGCEDFSVTFLYKCANKLSMDISEIITGDAPKLAFYNVNRRGDGMPVKRREEFVYRHIAPFLKNRLSEPFHVTIRYDAEAEKRPISLSTHQGQELDYILSGTMKIQLEDHVEILHAGDSVYYDSSHRHGMIAIDGEDCTFLAIVYRPDGEADIEPVAVVREQQVSAPAAEHDLIYKRFVRETVDEQGKLTDIDFNYGRNFNFAYDVVDELAKKCPDKRALLWLSKDKQQRNFSFSELSRLSAKTANFFRSLGIGKGDRVMLVLKRDYRFWLSLLALHKLGAVAVPATALLVCKDYEYRFNAGEIKGIVCTGDDNCTHEVDLACSNSPTLKIKVVAGSERDGWTSFDAGLEGQSEQLERVENDCDDPMVMFFSSGTTGYPKLAVHSFTYPLGHIVTARWWQNVSPDGIHFTISDTGWGKALWGKIYGQWLCEGCVFAYDFTKFDAHDILPLFKRYNITTFCCPPTMYRFFIKEDLSKYDLSSLKYATIAGEALNPEVFYQFQAATGIKLMEGFGQTETTLTIANLFGTEPKPGSMGKPNPQYDVVVLKPDGTQAHAGESGEIVIKTDRKKPVGLFIGYYGDKAKTEEVWHDGAYHTGDIAWIDEDGHFWYVGRTDDVIKSSGYRIGPFEIESVIMELPYVVECGVTGAHDDIRGQVVKAVIVLTKGTEPTEELKKEIQHYVKEHTAPYKYPRIVEFREKLPKTISGKIIRNQL